MGFSEWLVDQLADEFSEPFRKKCRRAIPVLLILAASVAFKSSLEPLAISAWSLAAEEFSGIFYWSLVAAAAIVSVTIKLALSVIRLRKAPREKKYPVSTGTYSYSGMRWFLDLVQTFEPGHSWLKIEAAAPMCSACGTLLYFDSEDFRCPKESCRQRYFTPAGISSESEMRSCVEKVALAEWISGKLKFKGVTLPGEK